MKVIIKNAQTTVKVRRFKTTTNTHLKIIFNGLNYELLSNAYLKEKLETHIAPVKKDLQNYTLKIEVKGGGQTDQITAAGIAILQLAPKLNAVLKKPLLQYKKEHRALFVRDSRRKYPKKQLGRGARARHQLSFR
jgi:small subunit ribosomal protein S9